MTESNGITNGDSNQENSEPLLVGTNITLNYDASVGNNLTYDTESEPLAVGTNLTIGITYAEAELLEEQLGINLDGSDNYLGSNITVIDGDRDWLERIDNNPIYGGMPSSSTDSVDYSYSWDGEEAQDTVDGSENNEESATNFNLSSDSNEPLLVGTNITFVIKEDTDSNSKTNSENESLYERDEKTPFALGTNLLIELPDEDGSQGSFIGTNLSTIGEDSDAMEEDFLGSGMISAEFATPTSNESDDYAWDFNGQLARFSNTSGGMGDNMDPDALFAASPWGGLKETGAVDGFEDVFPNAVGEMENNPFAGGFGGGDI